MKVGREAGTSASIKRYFFYAFGEIILVVIGILIALQINNWNIRNTNQQVLIKSFEQLLQSLETDIKDLDRVIETHTAAWNSVESYLNLLFSQNDFSGELLWELRKTTIVAEYKPRLSSFEAVKLNGLELIENPHLIDQLFLVYEEATNDYKIQEDNIKHILRTYVEPFIAENTKVKGGSFKNYELANYEKFANDPEYLGNIRGLHVRHYLVFEAAMRLKAQVLLLKHLLIIEKEYLQGKRRAKATSKEVNFVLPNHSDANEVFLTGSFGAWKDDAFKMLRRDDHWELMVDLNTNEIHYYKFIVDGRKIHDVDNPNIVASDAIGGYNSYIIP